MATAPRKKATPPEKVDATTELLYEVRNLSSAVAMLHTIFVKRTVLYWMLGIETFIVTAALIVMGVFIGQENAHMNALVDKSVGSCLNRNAVTDSNRTFLIRENNIQKESAGINAVIFSQLHLHLTKAQQAELARINKEQTQALKDWRDSQPQDIPCNKLKP